MSGKENISRVLLRDAIHMLDKFYTDTSSHHNSESACMYVCKEATLSYIVISMYTLICR